MRWTFLMVDADAAGADSARRQLTALGPGVEVLTAGSGEAALELLEERRVVPSMVFIDYGLPGMNGIEFIGSLRRRRWLEKVPVAMLSQPVADRTVVTAYRLGACAFLTKPVRTHELRETVRDFAHESVHMNAASVVSSAGSHLRSAA